jgi:hypothetical protein
MEVTTSSQLRHAAVIIRHVYVSEGTKEGREVNVVELSGLLKKGRKRGNSWANVQARNRGVWLAEVSWVGPGQGPRNNMIMI